VRNCWVDDEAGTSPLQQLVYLSRVMGREEALVVWGGGNTSIKVTEPDLLGRPTNLLLIKGTGSDMKAAEPKDFPAVRLDDIRASFAREAMTDEEMVAYFARCMVDPSAPRPSIETLLHGYLDATAVAHSHADAILALTNTTGREETVSEALGRDVALVPYRRPGFQLAKEVAIAVRNNPDARGVVLMNHGLITWGETAREAYDRHIDLVSRAEEIVSRRAPHASAAAAHGVQALPAQKRRDLAARLAPVLRGLLSQRARKILRFDDGADILDFLASPRLADVTRAGAATPDHMLNTKRRPLVLAAPDPSDLAGITDALRESVARYCEEEEAHYARFRTDEPLLDSAPRVVLMPGIGMWTSGRDARGALIPADIYHHTVRVVTGAEAIDRYASLSERDAFDAEYWPLELYKLSLAPPDRDLAGRIALVTGAAGAIGRAIARRLAEEGAHVVVSDLDEEGAAEVAGAIVKQRGHARAVSVRLDVTDEASVERAFDFARLTYGGLDLLVSNAGVAHVAPVEELSLADWEQSLAINATGHFLAARAAMRLFREQRIGGAMVFVATKNVTAPGKDFGAYSAAKAAEAQLARVLAIEGGEYGVRVNMVNPDAVFAGSGLWSNEVRQQRASSYGIPVDELEAHYSQRNLLRARITAEDVAEAVLWLASDRSAKTTGAMIPVDGGLREAFPR